MQEKKWKGDKTKQIGNKYKMLYIGKTSENGVEEIENDSGGA